MRYLILSLALIPLSGCKESNGPKQSGAVSTRIDDPSHLSSLSKSTNANQPIAKEIGREKTSNPAIQSTNRNTAQQQAAVLQSTNKVSPLKSILHSTAVQNGLDSSLDSTTSTKTASQPVTPVPVSAAAPTFGTQSGQKAEMIEMEIQVPNESATVPAALAPGDPSTPPADQKLIDGIASDFANKLSEPQNQNKPYDQLWNAAQNQSDEVFRKMFGQDAFLAYSLRAALEAKSIPGKN